MLDARGDQAEQQAEQQVTPPGRELLYWSDRTGVSRVPLADGGTAVRKETRGDDAPARLRHEASVLQRLSGVPGVPQLIELGPGSAWMLLSDTRGAALSESPAGTDPVWATRIGASLAGVVASVHRRGVIHKDVNPSNVLLQNADDGGDGTAVTLIDFDLATTFAEERPVFTHHSEVAGTLPYLAPEQTGRTGWPVDHRADLYALGATLYELLTGRAPFGNAVDEPLELIHAHLARAPQPPSALNPAVPEVLSAIVLRLLEKEPDQRYQSADGVAHDLDRLAALLADDPAPSLAGFGLGDRDFPLRLTAPSRLVGREDEQAALVAAYERVRAGGVGGLLVSGAPGVGKSALLDGLRPLVTAHGGWLVTGKFDQYRQDIAADAVPQALTALGRLLLAEPEERLAEHRERLLAGLGPNAPLAAMWPEFATLLGVEHEPPAGDPAEAQSRIYRMCVDLLRSVATPERPVVMVLDDLQWAPAFPIGVVDAVLTDEDLSGLLVVGAFRDGEVDATHPLSGMLERWQRLGVAPPLLALENLPPEDTATLLAEMLRLPAPEAVRLTEAVGARTHGNPFDTVELVNALRHEGALAPEESGWRWDADTIRRFVGSSDVVGLLTARIERLPAETARLLEIMGCLSGDVGPALLATAAGLSEDEVGERLAPALEDGLLVPVSTGPAGPSAARSSGHPAARFRHDRVQQAAHDHLSPEARDELHLSLARRLVDSPEWAGLAAEQYLAAQDAVASAADPAESRRAAQLFLAAGTRLKLVNAQVAESYLGAATSLLRAAGVPADDPLAYDVDVVRHEVLYTLGRLEDAEELFASIEERCADPLDLVGPAGMQISSMTGRGRPADAIALALRLLADLGVSVPPREELGADIARDLSELPGWLEQEELAGDRGRAEIDDPRVTAAADVVGRMLGATFFVDPTLMAWLVMRSWRIWAERGPAAPLVGCLANTAMVVIGATNDYRTGYRALRRIVAVGEAHGWEPMTSRARFLLTATAQHWFEPLEDVAAETQRARVGLLRGGDIYHAAFTHPTCLPVLFDLVPTLEEFRGHAATNAAFAAVTGITQVIGNMVPISQLAKAMRGETSAPGAFGDDSFDEQAYLAAVDEFPVARFYFHAHHAVAALVFGDDAALADHAGNAMARLVWAPGNYPLWVPYLAQGMSLAARVRAGAEDRDTLLAELDTCREWLAARAADAPMNFGHLVTLLDAERAWAAGDPWAAAVAYDEAIRQVGRFSRPWQQALITERAALFQLRGGLQLTGRRLLADAHGQYAAWGATGKVRQLEEAHPFLAAAEEPGASRGRTTTHARARRTLGHTSRTSAESIDLLGVLRAAQALASETNLDRLRGRVVEVLTMMTGATAVRLAQWKDDAGEWFLPDDAPPEGSGQMVTVDEAGRRGLVPVSAFRYAERTGEPLRVDDAACDDRFSRDPYLAGLERCSLLLVPIQSHGRTRAMLLLENRLSRGAFSAERLDAVMLIAGQLAVCLDNALAERFRSLVQRSSELTLVCDRTGLVSYASSAAGELLGVEAAALVGRSVADVVAAGDRHGVLEWVARTESAPGETHAPLVCGLDGAPDIEQRWAEVTLTDLSADPAVGGLMLRLRDVTERRRLERALEELATTDPLTGTANRRRFDETLRQETERCLRAGNPLTLVLLDIDHFKSVNDTHGHPVGDAVLKAVAAQARTAVRDIDLVARVGGEEFAVLLIDVGLHEGAQVADRMRKVVEGTVVHFTNRDPLSCTVSLGVAEFTGDATELMARADAALYRAKAEGRNRVCTSD